MVKNWDSGFTSFVVGGIIPRTGQDGAKEERPPCPRRIESRPTARLVLNETLLRWTELH